MSENKFLILESNLESLQGKRWTVSLNEDKKFLFFYNQQSDEFFQICKVSLEDNLVVDNFNISSPSMFYFKKIRPIFFSFLFIYTNLIKEKLGNKAKLLIFRTF
jgi:hypothetical protein